VINETLLRTLGDPANMEKRERIDETLGRRQEALHVERGALID
jgi:hypothetical protein